MVIEIFSKNRHEWEGSWSLWLYQKDLCGWWEGVREISGCAWAGSDGDHQPWGFFWRGKAGSHSLGPSHSLDAGQWGQPQELGTELGLGWAGIRAHRQSCEEKELRAATGWLWQGLMFLGVKWCPPDWDRMGQLKTWPC